ncbi:MAG: hypothetical protein IPL67_19790 [Ignavibacteria bacterium]|nr:hypothetical protein [Ignavibacteria bacterium]
MKKFIVSLILFSGLDSTAIAQTGWFWQNPLPQGNQLQSVDFSNSEAGWAVGQYGTILRTINGGTNWTQTVVRNKSISAFRRSSEQRHSLDSRR